MNTLKTYLSTHVFYLILIFVGLVGFKSWLSEHDARLQAQAAVKLAETDAKASAVRVAQLETTLTTVKAAADAQIASLEKQKAAIKTVQQAVPIIQQLAPAIQAEVVPSSPSSVSVDSIELAKTLTQCREDAVAASSCQIELKTEQQIVAEKDTQLTDKNNEIVALKKKPSFWNRVKSTSKLLGTGVAIGAVIAKVLL